jgi:hypothetical protein
MRSVTAYYILCGLLAAGTAQAQGMIDADHAFVQAVAASDLRALERLLDTDFTWTDFNGQMQTKPEFLRNLPPVLNRAREQAELRHYTYGEIGDVQENYGRMHLLRVWIKRPDGWKAIVYQEVMSLDAPPSFAPGAGKDCENPCTTIPYQPKNETERQVVAAYSKLETAAVARNSAAFAPMVAEEFVAASSNSNKVANKRGRMEDFDHAKNGGVAPTPLLSARMFDFGDAVLMISEHQPDRGKPLHVTRVWVKRNGSWVETLSYQTSVAAAPASPLVPMGGRRELFEHGSRRRSLSNPVDPPQAGPAVEITIKAQYRTNTVTLHHGNMDGIAGRHHGRILSDLRRAQHVGLLDRDHVVNHFQSNLKGWPDRIAPVNGRVAVKNLLQYFSVRDQTLPRCN